MALCAKDVAITAGPVILACALALGGAPARSQRAEAVAVAASMGAEVERKSAQLALEEAALRDALAASAEGEGDQLWKSFGPGFEVREGLYSAVGDSLNLLMALDGLSRSDLGLFIQSVDWVEQPGTGTWLLRVSLEP